MKRRDFIRTAGGLLLLGPAALEEALRVVYSPAVELEAKVELGAKAGTSRFKDAFEQVLKDLFEASLKLDNARRSAIADLAGDAPPVSGRAFTYSVKRTG